MKPLAFHPFSKLLPDMTAAEKAALRADLAANGQCDPIMLFEGKILVHPTNA
ncbi:MAG TPA: hypothetical protein VFC78_01010 [Tepidisphaeraceae bacterium]|nr:hypothetical protein [Tepidisphaeraceae bacterium]